MTVRKHTSWLARTRMQVALQSLYLSLHFHHLHMYSHPRPDTNVLEAMLLAFIWRAILHNYVQDLNVSTRLLQKLQWVIRSTWLLPLTFWLLYACRSYVDGGILVIGELTHAVLLKEALVQSPHHSQLLCILVKSSEAAFIVGVLPAILTRHDEILHEPGESLRITFLVLVNCLVLSILNFLNEYNAVLASAAGDGRLSSLLLPPGHGGASPSLSIAAISCPVSEADSQAPQQPLQQRTSTKQERRSPCREAPTPPSSIALPADAGHVSHWLALYEQNSDRAHLGLLTGQSALVCVMLVDFMHTPQWRAHAISLLCNFVVLYACIAFRKACYRRSA